MHATRALRQGRQPLIKFLGKRSIPKEVDHSPHAHPAAPSDELPGSFASYRSRVQQHGPLGGEQQKQSSSQPSSSGRQGAPSGSAAAQTASPYGAIGGHSAKQLGSLELAKGEVWDRNDLPKRFHRVRWTEAEIEAIESAGASMVVP
ncbi:hypothetical protein LTR36_005081 [Oleoguttula mirabilis]|uniref:Uncharacterized protein n=1 Tax=Oleoguttula mirabilis TaxID=1507867 RepID=A0AAV9JVZ4_9PEZI|nr:hypothetical protein LTR36_005081 [Oleoguttula mirabilis]